MNEWTRRNVGGVARGVGMLWLLVLAAGTLWGQPDVKPKRSAVKAYEKAVDAYRIHDLVHAIEWLDRATEVSPTYARAWFLKAQLLEEVGSERAMPALQEALRLDDRLHVQGWVDLAVMHWERGEYDQGVACLEAIPSDKVFGEEVEAKRAWVTAGLRFSVEAMAEPVGEVPVPLPGRVNSSAREYYGALDLTGTHLVFTRSDLDREGPDARQRGVAGGEDFWESRLDARGQWGEARPLRGVNTPMNEGAPALSGDGQTMVFTACELPREGYGPRRGKGSCDLFESTWDPRLAQWSEGQNLGAPNSSGWESQPTLSADGGLLIFAKAARGATAQSDLYMCRRRSDGLGWTAPEKLPGAVNTSLMEESPYLHADGQTLYFSSNGHPGFGGLDVFVSKRQPDGSWGRPRNLGKGVNSHANDNSLIVFPSGDRALFASNRGGEGLDFWEVPLPTEAQAIEVARLTGVVVDRQTGIPVTGQVRLVDASSGLPVGETVSRAEAGFMMPLPTRGTYSFEVRSEGYVFAIQSFENWHDGTDVDVRIALDPIVAGQAFVLDAIHFESGSAQLRQMYQAGCTQLALWMAENPSVRIRLIGHTDDVGRTEVNQALSQERAEAVKFVLEASGVSPQRMVAEGRGADAPIASNETEEGRAKNRRVEVVIE